MIHTSILQEVIKEVERIFLEEISDKFVYHNKAHTQSVVDNSDLFAQHYNLSNSEREILAIACWFHDVGYSCGYDNHEDSSERIARAFLQKLNLPEAKQDQIAGCIQATKVETEPANLLEEIIKDADLANLGEDSFLDHSRRLRKEWFTLLDEYHTDREWNELNQNFMVQHKYYTSIAIEQLGKKKLENLRFLKNELVQLEKR